jgi:outer membrane protein
LKKNLFVFSILVMGTALAYGQATTPAPAPAAAAPAAAAPVAGPAPTKIAIINITGAILGTKDGQVAAGALQSRFAPRQQELQKKQSEIASLREQLSKGSATMSQDAKDKLMRDIDSGTKALNRDTEDAQADLDQEQGKLQQELGGKIMQIIDQYAAKNAIAVVLDVSNPQTPVLWAASAVDITSEIVKLYDQAHPSSATASAAPAKPAAGAPAAAPAAAPKKK